MIYRTSDDGRRIERVYEGDHPRAPMVPGRRIRTFLELIWERSEQGFADAEAGLRRVMEIVRELRETLQGETRNASKRRKAAKQESGMILHCEAFHDGHRRIYRLSEDGRRVEHIYEGSHPYFDPPVLGRRTCAFVDVAWERSEQGFADAEAGLRRLIEIVRELREAPQDKSRNAAKRRKVAAKV
jgi:hypothetical protein